MAKKKKKENSDETKAMRNRKLFLILQLTSSEMQESIFGPQSQKKKKKDLKRALCVYVCDTEIDVYIYVKMHTHMLTHIFPNSASERAQKP